jgi:hypothetical protein
VTSLVALQSGGYTHPWKSGYVLGTMLVGLALIGAWILYEAKFARHPMVPGELFKGQRIVGLAYVVAFAAGMNFFSVCSVLLINGVHGLTSSRFSTSSPLPSPTSTTQIQSRLVSAVSLLPSQLQPAPLCLTPHYPCSQAIHVRFCSSLWCS